MGILSNHESYTLAEDSGVCVCVRVNRPLRPSPVRVSEVDLLDLAQEAAQESPSLGNCFNSGLCAWLCKHRCSTQNSRDRNIKIGVHQEGH